jgi:signal recognition particle subunit SEC65
MATENISRTPRITNKAFRLSRTVKRRLALQSFASAEVRAAYRRMMIEAQVNGNRQAPKAKVTPGNVTAVAAEE